MQFKHSPTTTTGHVQFRDIIINLYTCDSYNGHANSNMHIHMHRSIDMLGLGLPIYNQSLS